MRIFVDTNVLVYSRDFTEPRRQPIADARLTYCWASESGRTSVQVLSEFYVTVTRKLMLSPAKTQADVRLLYAWQPLAVDKDVVSSAWTIEDRYGLSWWDSLIVAAAEHLGCDQLLTEDLQHGQTFGEITVISPFIESPPAL